MTCERIDYYRVAEKANVKRLVLNTSFFCALFAAVCSFVYFFLPNTETHSNAASHSAAIAQGESKAETSENTETASLAALGTKEPAAVRAQFFWEEEVSSPALSSATARREDLGLILYRQPQTRSAVEGFYYQVTGNRETAIAILDAAEAYGIPLSLAFSLAYAESKFKPYASHVNKNGSIDRGLFQLNSNAFPNLSEEEFFDPKISAQKGLKHLKFFLKTAGNEVAALAMYNAGAAKVSANSTPHSTLDYVAEINSYRTAIDESFAKDVLAFLEQGNSGLFAEKVAYTKS